jgi:hypothetical protein
VTGINDDDLGAHLYASENYGADWRPIMANLPDEVAYVILEDPVNEEMLYAGMYRGVYVSVDRGQSWSLLGKELPATAISDLVIQERTMDLVAATHGRGIYRTNLEPLHQAFEEGTPTTDILFETPVARLPWINDTHRDPRYSTMEKVPITFFLLREGWVTLSIVDSGGEMIWSQDLPGKKGFNQLRWDLVVARQDRQEAYFWQYLRFARAGTYEVRVTGEGVDLSGGLTIVER